VHGKSRRVVENGFSSHAHGARFVLHFAAEQREVKIAAGELGFGCATAVLDHGSTTAAMTSKIIMLPRIALRGPRRRMMFAIQCGIGSIVARLGEHANDGSDTSFEPPMARCFHYCQGALCRLTKVFHSFPGAARMGQRRI
jgi:hypothetical protein